MSQVQYCVHDKLISITSVRALILRYYLSFKRLEYKRGLVLRSTENQENRVKRELEMNEDDVRVLLKVSVPQGSALMEDMFRKAMLPSKAPPVKPMELLRRVKKVCGLCV